MSKVVILIISFIFTILVLVGGGAVLFVLFNNNIAVLNDKIDTLEQKIDNDNQTSTDTTDQDTAKTYKEFMSVNLRGEDTWLIEDKKTANDMTTMTQVLTLVLDSDQETNYQVFLSATNRIDSFLTTEGWVKGTPVKLGSNSLFATPYTNPAKNGRTVTVTAHASAGSPTYMIAFNYIEGEAK